MRPRFLMPLLLSLALCWPLPGQAAPAAPGAPADGPLVAALVRMAGPTVYPSERVTLTVQVATTAAEPLPVFAFLVMAPQLSQRPNVPPACDNPYFQHFDCAVAIDATHPITLTFDAIVRDATPPGVITSTLEVWPMAIGRSALISTTLPLTVIVPARVYLPLAAR